MPIQIIPAHFNAVAGCWIACYPHELKRARGYFISDGKRIVGFAPTLAEAKRLTNAAA